MPLPLSFKSLIIILTTKASNSKSFLLFGQKTRDIRPGLKSILKSRDLLLNLHWPMVLLVMNMVVGQAD